MILDLKTPIIIFGMPFDFGAGGENVF